MTVDRGELRYRISVEDRFTAGFRRFREELLAARNTANFVREQTRDLRGLGQGFRNVSQAVRQATADTRQNATEVRNASRSRRAALTDEERATAEADREAIRRARQISARYKDNEKTLRERARLQQQVRRDEAAEARRAATENQARLRQIAAEAQAQRNLAREHARIRRAQEADERARAASARAQARSTRQTTAGLSATEREQRKLLRSILDTDSGVNRAAFTFRRLFGILAAFTVAREGFAAFTGLIGSAINFNRTVEDSETNIASLFVAIGQVTDEQGRLVDGAEAFRIAQTEARKQTKLLRLDALKTVATYEELLVAFQAGLGPGLAAGLNVEQIRQITTLVSQAAATFPGLQQNQLPEEIRSLITGTGQLRTTRLLQIVDNKEIRAARDAGSAALFDLLTKKLKPFALASEETQKNFSGLLARIKDSVEIGAGGAALVFFENLKGLLKDVGDLFLSITKDAQGNILDAVANPQAVATLAILFDGLDRAVTSIRAGIGSLDLGQVQNALAALANTIAILAEVGVGFVRGLVAGLSDVTVIASRLFGGVDFGALQNLVALGTRLLVLLVSGSLAISAIGFFMKLAVGPFVAVVNIANTLFRIVGGVLFAIGKIPAALIPFGAAIALIGVGFGKVAEMILGFPLSLGSVVELLVLTFSTGFGTVVRQGEIIFKQFANVLIGLFTDPIGTIAALFNDLFSGVLQVASGLAAVLGISEDFRAEIESAVATFDRLSSKVKPKPLFDTAKDRADLDTFLNESQGKFNAFAEQVAADAVKVEFEPFKIPDANAPELSGFESFIAGINTQLNGILGADIVDEEGLAAALAKAAALIESFAGGVTGKAQERQLTAFEVMLQKIITTNAKLEELIGGSISRLGSFISDTLVDAFDPTEEVDILERLARFLQDIARMILNQITQLLIATAVAKAFGVPLPGDSSPIPTLPSFAAGGEVPNTGSPIARPSSVPASDTTLAWLTPREYVIPVRAVMAYGADVMEQIRRGAIDPGALKALAGLRTRRRVVNAAASRGRSYASGGLVRPAAAGAAAGSGSGNGSGGAPVATLVANDNTLERMLNGGRQSFMEFFRMNASTLSGILGRR